MTRARALCDGDASTAPSAEVVGRLDAAVAAVDLDHPEDGVAIFVAPGETHVLSVDFPVREQVLVGDTFATRDLLRGLGRIVPHRVLVLGERSTRLFAGDGHRLVEDHSGPFPLSCPGQHGDVLESGGYATHTDRPDSIRRAFWQRVDEALGAADATEARPVILVGATRDLAGFGAVTRHGGSIVGEIVGDHHHDDAAAIARIAGPALAEHLAQWRAVLVAELGESMGTGRAVSGVTDTLEAARNGRVDVVVVDDGAPDTADVDRLVTEAARHGGRVLVVDAGGLGELGPVAARLRT